jgi:hypothetical protein
MPRCRPDIPKGRVPGTLPFGYLSRGVAMSKRVIIEGVLFLVAGLASMIEGLRVVALWKIRGMSEPVGPGYYLCFFSVLLMIVGVSHIVANYNKIPKAEKRKVHGSMRIKMISMVVVLGIYIVAINLVGYIVATLCFFLLEFRVVKIKSWGTNIILSLVMTAIYYFVFVKGCEMIFPPGQFFGY